MSYIDYQTYKKLKYYVKTGEHFSSSIHEWNTFADNQFIDDVLQSQISQSGYRHRTNENAKRYVADHKRKSMLQVITLILLIAGVIISLISLLKP